MIKNLLVLFAVIFCVYKFLVTLISLFTYLHYHSHTQDECSFVSLRDVERAMIVFEWFYENNDSFEQLLKVEGYEV